MITNIAYVYLPEGSVKISDFEIDIAGKYCVRAATGTCFLPQDQVVFQMDEIREMYRRPDVSQDVIFLPVPPKMEKGTALNSRDAASFGIELPNSQHLERLLSADFSL